MKQDIMIQNGSIQFDDSNSFEKRLGGEEAVIQRIKTALSLKRGDFIYNKDMGIDMRSLDFTKERDIKILEMLINEIAGDFGECKAKIISLNTRTMTADMLFAFKNNSYRTEVKLYG